MNKISGTEERYYYCPNCNKVQESIISYNIEGTNDNNILTKPITYCICDCEFGNYAYEIDTKIVDAILRLNKLGMTTLFSCEGHYNSYDLGDGYIYFKDKLKSCPDMWHLDTDYDDEYNTIRVTIPSEYLDENLKYKIPKAEFEEFKNRYIESLYRWIQELENDKPNL